LRRSKNKVAQNGVTKPLANRLAVGPPKIPILLFFNFFVIFHQFFNILAFDFTYLYLLENFKFFLVFYID